MYSDDHNGRLPFVKHGPSAWIDGWLDYDGNNRSNWDVTADIERSPLWNHSVSTHALFKCPGDRSVVPYRGQRLPRVRSMSMLNWIGGRGEDREMGWSGPGWRSYRLQTDIMDPGPSRTFVFLDEREDSINDGMFVVDMTGYLNQPAALAIVDIPASYHGGAGGLSFADGHSEIRRWQDPRPPPPVVPRKIIPYNNPSPNNPDIVWMQERATRRLYVIRRPPLNFIQSKDASGPDRSDRQRAHHRPACAATQRLAAGSPFPRTAGPWPPAGMIGPCDSGTWPPTDRWWPCSMTPPSGS